VERPGLEYQHAFDVCAVEAHRRGGPVVLSASSPFYARELVKRIEALQPAGLVIPGRYGGREALEARLGPEVQVGTTRTVQARGATLWAEPEGASPLGRSGTLATTAVWAEPEGGDAERVLAAIERVLAPGGRLCAVTTGWLRRALPEWQREKDRPAERPVGLGRTVRWLRRAGFAVEATYGFHGPASMVWGFASRLPAAVGREELVDRCLAAMRKTYVVGGWHARWAPVSVVLARRP
jgi:hypothetical protein